MNTANRRRVCMHGTCSTSRAKRGALAETVSGFEKASGVHWHGVALSFKGLVLAQLANTQVF